MQQIVIIFRSLFWRIGLNVRNTKKQGVSAIKCNLKLAFNFLKIPSPNWSPWEGCTGCLCGNLRERDHCGDPDADGGIILRWIFKRWEGVVGTEWSWLRIGTGGGHLSTMMNVRVPKMRGISWLAAEPVSFSRRTLLHVVSKQASN